MIWRRLLQHVLFVASAVASPAIAETAFKSAEDLTHSPCCSGFQLFDHNGIRRTIADFRGKVVVLFFGYTQCPDVCPTTMSEMNSIIRKLGPDGARVQVLFVTIDPERDTPALLANYVPSFNKKFLGLYGDAEATAAAAKEFRVFYQKQPGSTPGSYSMDHSVGSYIFDTKGKIRVFASYGQSQEKIVSDIRTLLNGG